MFGMGINWDWNLWSVADAITAEWRQRKGRVDKRVWIQHSSHGTRLFWEQYLPLPACSLPQCVSLFSCLTQIFRCSQCPPFIYFHSYTRVRISVHIFLLLFLLSHHLVTLLVHSKDCALGLGIFSGNIVLPAWSKKSLSFALLLSLTLSPFSLVQRLCNLLSVITVDTSKKYDFNFSKKIWIM